MSHQGKSTTDLLRLWHDGERKARDAVVLRHVEFVRRVVREQIDERLRAKLDSQDVVQEAMIDFLTSGPRFVPVSGSQFRSLLAGIVKNSVRDQRSYFGSWRRNIARERELRDAEIDLSVQAAPDALAEERERKATLRLVMEFLEPDARDVVILRDSHNLSFRDIGRELGISEAAASKRYRRSLQRMREMMGTIRRRELPDGDDAAEMLSGGEA